MLAGRSEHKGDLNQPFVSSMYKHNTKQWAVLARAGDGRILTYGLAPPSSRFSADDWLETTADLTRSQKTGAGPTLGGILEGVES